MPEQPLEPQSPEMVWQMYESLVTQCQHFNDLESTYRTLASTWLLAAFGGVGYVLSSDVGENGALLIAAIGGAAALGIILIWILDLKVYHTLLVAIFAEQIKLEHAYRWLPQTAHHMQAEHRGRGVVRRVVWFYVVSYLLMVGVAAFSVGASASDLTMMGKVLLTLGVLLLAGVPVAWQMLYEAQDQKAPDVRAYEESIRSRA
jgi:hypothetical protein